MRTLCLIGLVASCFGVSAAVAQPHGGDVILEVQAGSIVTGSGYDACGAFLPAHVYGSDFGEFLPDETGEPGFDNNPGTFALGTNITFRIMDALRVWDGADFDVIPTERLEISFAGTFVRLTPTTATTEDGFALSVGANGEWHRHFDFRLLAPAGQGVYLLALTLRGGGASESEPFWIVFNQMADEAEHDAAIAWARVNLAGKSLCGDIDFNNDCLFPDTTDLFDFLAVFGGAACPTEPPAGNGCDAIDFNGDGVFPDNTDLMEFLDVFGGGEC